MSDFLKDNQVAITVGLAAGLFPLLIACVVAFLGHRHALKQIHTRLYSERRLDAVADIFSKLMHSYLKARGMLASPSDSKAFRTCEVAMTAWKDFDNCSFRNRLFLTSHFDARLLAISNELLQMHGDFVQNITAANATHSQAVSDRKHYQKLCDEHRSSLVEDGEMHRKIQQLRTDLRDYLRSK